MIKTKIKGGILLPLFFLLCISCVHIHNSTVSRDKQLYLQRKSSDIERIDDFIDNYVFNAYDRELIYSFKKGYSEEILGQNIKDFYVDGNLLLFFTNNFLLTNYQQCPSIELKRKYSTITYNKGYIALASQKKIDLYSLEYCGLLSIQHKKKLSNFFLFNSFIIYYDKQSIIIEELLTENEYLNIGMKNEILNIRTLDNRLICIICRDGNIVYFDVIKKRVIYTVYLESSLIYGGLLDNVLFVLDRDGYFKRYSIKFTGNKFDHIPTFSKKVADPYGALIAKSYPAIITNNNLIFNSKEIQLFYNLNNLNFDIINGNLIYLKEGRLSQVFIDKLRFIKKVKFNDIKKSACIIDNSVIFKDLDNKNKAINLDSGVQEILKAEPAFCDRRIILKDGYFILDNGLLKFAEIVKKNEKYKLLMRIIDNIYYFYIE